jgi:predicted PurR-regulated permease PerM
VAGSGARLAYTQPVTLKAGAKALLILASVAVVAAGIKLASELLAPLVVAFCLAAVTTPVVRWLTKRRVPEYAAVALTMVGSGAVLAAFGATLVIAAQDVGKSLPRLQRSLQIVRQDVTAWLEAQNVGNASRIVEQVEPLRVDSTDLGSALAQTHELAVACSVVFFLVLFILLEMPSLHGKLNRSLGWRAYRFTALRNVMVEMQRYLMVKTWLSALMGVSCGIFCWALGVEYPVLWGLVTFLLNYIPVVGALFATIAPAAFALLSGGAGTALIVVVGLLIIHNVIGNIVEPAVLGRAIQLSPLVVMLSLVVWGWLLGPVGALLSVPLTTVLKYLLASADDLRWVAVMLGPDGEGEPDRDSPPSQFGPLGLGADASLQS